MVDTFNDKDEDLEVVEIDDEGEAISLDDKAGDPPAEGAAADDSEDERLAQSDEDDDEGDDDADQSAESLSRRKRQRRKARQRRVMEAKDLENQFLRQQLSEVQQRLQRVEGTTIAHSEQTLDQRIAERQRQIDLAEDIMYKALQADNQDDYTQALRARDAAKDEVRNLTQAKQQVSQYREQQSTQAPDDPRVVHYRTQWIDANKGWFDGRSEDSQVALVIDQNLKAAGFDPATPDYWRELTRRCAERLGDDPEPVAAAPRRKPPPQSASRESPAAGKNQVYVTPAMKQAMIDAGYWDDPEKRNRMLKRYAEQRQPPAGR